MNEPHHSLIFVRGEGGGDEGLARTHGRYLRKTWRNRGKNEVRPGAWPLGSCPQGQHRRKSKSPAARLFRILTRSGRCGLKAVAFGRVERHGTRGKHSGSFGRGGKFVPPPGKINSLACQGAIFPVANYKSSCGQTGLRLWPESFHPVARHACWRQCFIKLTPRYIIIDARIYMK